MRRLLFLMCFALLVIGFVLVATPGAAVTSFDFQFVAVAQPHAPPLIASAPLVIQPTVAQQYTDSSYDNLYRSATRQQRAELKLDNLSNPWF